MLIIKVYQKASCNDFNQTIPFFLNLNPYIAPIPTEYIQNLSWFLGSFTAILSNVMLRFMKDLSFVLGNVGSSKVVAWLFTIGTLGFTFNDCKRKVEYYELMETSRKVLLKWLLLAPYYYTTSNVWVSFNKNDGLDAETFANLLENSHTYLPENVLASLMKKITRNNRKFISKSELEKFVNRKIPRNSTIFFMWLTSLSFLADGSWFVGSIAYVISSYTTGDNSVLFYQVSAFLGSNFKC